jgi:hypothetical protein
VDGTITNYGSVDSIAFGSSLVGVFGDRSQAVNKGVMTARGDDTAVLFALGEVAEALNLGKIVITGATNVGIQGVIGNTHLTNKGVVSIAADGSIGMGGFGNGHQVSNFGTIDAHGTFTLGISARGGGPLSLPGLDLDVLNAGRVSTEGDAAIGVSLGVGQFGFLPAEGGWVDNRGVIDSEGDGAAGVAMIGDGHRLANSGRITADGGSFDSDTVGTLRAAGVLVSGDGVLVENARSGIIRSEDAASAAVELNVLERGGLPASEMSSRLENSGLIAGPGLAVRGGAGQETVVNHGRIVGDVDLGYGADTFVFARGGNVAGEVVLGAGDDLARIENGSGTTRIADFVAGAPGGDVVDVSVFFSTVAELLAHSVQRGGDVVINLDHNDRLVLENVRLSALNDGDFFV